MMQKSWEIWRKWGVGVEKNGERDGGGGWNHDTSRIYSTVQYRTRYIGLATPPPPRPRYRNQMVLTIEQKPSLFGHGSVP